MNYPLPGNLSTFRKQFKPLAPPCQVSSPLGFWQHFLSCYSFLSYVIPTLGQSTFSFHLFYFIHFILPSWPIRRTNCLFLKCQLPISSYFPSRLWLSSSRIAILFHFLIPRRTGTWLTAPHHGKKMEMSKRSAAGIWWVNDSVRIVLLLCD